MKSAIHPDYLFDLERQATLTESERALRDLHLRSCSTCRLEHGFRSDFAREPLESADDHALLERAVQGALTTITLPPAPKRLGRWAVPSAIGAGVLAAGLAAASLREQRAPVVAASAPPSVARPSPVTAAPAEPTAKEPAKAALPSEPERVSARPISTTAAQLFARANSARRASDIPEAVRLYRRLLAEFPASREARTSEVTMARLLLDTRGDAAAALGLLDRYVRESPHGNLAEEARLGRAEAFARLGQPEAEAAAWSDLLEHFPSTVHRGRAEARLQELAAPAP